jgi:hypothetical protein
LAKTEEERKAANRVASKKYKETNPNYKVSRKRSEEKRKGLRKEAIKRYYTSLKGRAYSLRRGAFGRARKFNLPFDITKEWVLEKLAEGVCEVTKLPFTFVTMETYGVQNNQHPLSPSIDRIDPKLGYLQSNCRVVCLIFNICKHHWKDSDVDMFVSAYFKEKELGR